MMPPFLILGALLALMLPATGLGQAAPKEAAPVAATPALPSAEEAPTAQPQPPATPDAPPVVPPGPTADAPPPLPPRDQPPPLPPREAPLPFFVERAGQPEGPLALEEVQTRLRDGRMTRDTLVWQRGMPAWRPAGEVEALAAAAPPALPSPTETLADRHRRLLVGTWEAQWTQGNMAVAARVRYNEDGTYSGAAQFRPLGGMGQPGMARISGRWQIRPVDERSFALTSVPNDGTPSETSVQTILDDNSLRDETLGVVSRRIAG